MSPLITSEIIQTVHKLYGTDDKIGTCFNICYEGQQYLITAAHMLEQQNGKPVASDVDVIVNGQFVSILFDPIDINSGADIAITRLAQPFSHDYEIPLGMMGMILSQPVFMLGYQLIAEHPAGMSSMGVENSPIGFIRRGIWAGKLVLDGGQM